MAEIALRFQNGLDSDSPPLEAAPRWRDGNRMRFRGGSAEPIGGWTRLVAEALDAPVRGLFAWDSVSAAARRQNLAVGTARGLHVIHDGEPWTISPLRLSRVLPPGAVTGTAGSGRLAVAWPAHGAALGDPVYLSIGLLPAGPWTLDNFHVDPLTAVQGSTRVLYRLPGHGLSSGDVLDIAASEPVGGMEVSGLYTVRVVDADTLAFHLDDPAGASGAGGGTVVVKSCHALPVIAIPGPNTLEVALPQPLAAAFANSGGYLCHLPLAGGASLPEYASGWSTGGYGTGTWGGVAAPAEAREPRLWSFAAWGRELLACPRGEGLYRWALNPSRRAEPVAGAPANIGWMTVTAQRTAMCFGASGSDGAFDPLLIRWSDIEDLSVWQADATNNAGQLRLGSGSRILRGVQGAGQVLLWTDRGLHGLAFTGDSGSVYALNVLAEDCGLAGPLAMAEWRGAPVWLTPGRAVLRLEGGVPQPLDCRVRRLSFDAVPADRLGLVAAGSLDAAGELWFLLPETGENARPRAAFLNGEGGWSLAELDRAVLLDTPQGLAMGDEAGGLWLHELAEAGADGGSLNAWAESTPVLTGSGAATFLTASADMTGGPLALTLTTETASRSTSVSEATPSGALRVTGRRATLRLAGGSARFRCAGIRLEAVPAGRRV